MSVIKTMLLLVLFSPLWVPCAILSLVFFSMFWLLSKLPDNPLSGTLVLLLMILFSPALIIYHAAAIGMGYLRFYFGSRQELTVSSSRVTLSYRGGEESWEWCEIAAVRHRFDPPQSGYDLELADGRTLNLDTFTSSAALLAESKRRGKYRDSK